jgi:hypothetical protein
MPKEISGMESYIVRIYRRGKEKSKELVGVVERAGDETQHAFKTPDELLEILCSPGPAPKRRARKGKPRLRIAAPPPDGPR